jgi:hypothetical protein
MEKNAFLIQSSLFERGWTKSLIRNFLPEPDQTKPNPWYRSASSMKLYKLERVEQIEASEKFAIEKAKSEKRRESSQKAVSSKLAKTMEYVEKVEVKIPKMSKNQLIHRACRHYNDWNYDSEEPATKDSDHLFLERICVNYLRHELTRYHFHLNEVHGKVGFGGAYFAIRKKIFVAIAEIHPWLEEECNRQEKR